MMEDGFPLFDPNNDSARQEQKLKEFYEEFSAHARKRLMSKNVVRPESVYDILYPKTRETLLSKNKPVIKDIEEDSKFIRENLLSKIIENQLSLDEISENFRKSLMSRAKIQSDSSKMQRQIDSHRDYLLSKNRQESSFGLDDISENHRRNNVSKNKLNPSTKNNIDDTAEASREKNLSKNNGEESKDLLNYSEQFRNEFRKRDIHKNVPTREDLDKNSEEFRKNNIHKNKISQSNIEDDSVEFRRNQISKNVNNNSDVDEDSKVFRDKLNSKNTPKEQDLLKDSQDFRNKYRDNDISKNSSKQSNLEKDSEVFRRDNISSNVPSKSDLKSQSEVYRQSDLSKNTDIKSNLDEVANNYRENVSDNTKETNLEKDSIDFRELNISNNDNKSSDLEGDSVVYRNSNNSNNNNKTSDLESDSIVFRGDNESRNDSNVTNLEEDSVVYRDNNISSNKPRETNLEIDSNEYRESDLSKNKPTTSDLEKDSESFRDDDLSFNSPKNSDLEIDSVPFREGDLSFNTPSESDLEVDSVPFRNDDLSFNVPSESDLEVDSVPFRISDLSANVPSNTDLETDSVPFRNDDLSANVPNETDLESDSVPFRNDDLSRNVPNESDLQVDSVPFRNDDLSRNILSTSNLIIDSEDFRNDDLSKNVPNESDLGSDSDDFRLSNQANNVPINSNLQSESIAIRDNNLSSNVPKETDLLSDSSPFRDKALSSNVGFGLLGVNVDGIGTSAFLGVSRVFTQGILIRTLLMSKNNPKPSTLVNDGGVVRESLLGRNKWIPQASGIGSSLEYGSSNTNFDLLDSTRKSQGSLANLAGYNDIGSPSKTAIEANAEWFSRNNLKIQSNYGSGPRNLNDSADFDSISFSDKAFYTDRSNPLGGSYESSTFQVNDNIWYSEGYVTQNIRLYNIERNSFNLAGVQVNGLDGFGNLENFQDDPDFQGLLAKTIGSLGVRESVSTQGGTNSTPLSIITLNGGTYFKGQGDLMRPGVDPELGSAESMMAKTALGNPYEDEAFYAGRRGVRHIVNTIKNSNASEFTQNYDPQNNTAYVTGKNVDGSPKISRQRFTINNPYAPQGAGRLLFFIKNYASNEQFFFPPYIQSISNTENANWNSTNFLGRPEAIYTYNNSSRDASISFYVLTDYAQRVDIGRDWNNESMNKVEATFNRHHTDSDKNQNDARKAAQERLNKLKAELTEKVIELNSKIANNSGQQVNILKESSPEFSAENSSDLSNQVQLFKDKEKQLDLDEQQRVEDLNTEQADLKQRKSEALKEIKDAEGKFGSIDRDFNTLTNYSESNPTSTNIYNLDVVKKEFNNGETICKPEDTIVRINSMKEKLMFQPSYFSGDKVDFVRKIEFLSKLTRPAAASGNALFGEDSGTGFSFTKPPVCHIHLGDWWNHDIIVNSVSFDYADSPWSLDNGRVQPMWTLVTIDFNMIGPFKSFDARPPLATDEGGMYSPLRKTS